MAEPATPRTQGRPPAADRAAHGLRRVRAAWRALAPEQRLAGFAALALFVTMFLPWYSVTRAITVGKGGAKSVTDAHTAIAVFSWVEAAVLLVALAVLLLLFARGERRGFHLPGGDGTVILAAGLWACLLVIWRFFDKPDLGGTVGLRWGIFVALGAAAFLAYTGNRLRAAHRPEPPLRAPVAAERPPEEPIEIHLPAERPHLAETRVMPDRETTRAMPERRPGQPPPLNRSAAEQDTAEFRAAEQSEGPEPDDEGDQARPSDT